MHERFNKKYRAVSVKSTDNREVHDNIRGKICYPAYFKVGERGWFLCEMSDILFPTPVHRMNTSTVRKVEYYDNGFTVFTENTTYEFEEVDDEEVDVDAES